MSSPAVPVTSHRRTSRIFFGWKIVGAGAAIIALQAGLILQAFGSYAVILEERYGWSKTTMSLAYSFNRAESGLLGPLQGWMLKKYGSKRIMRVGAVILAGGFVAFSQVQAPVQFIAAFFVIAVGASLSGFMTILTEAVHWFERKRARALSVLSMGMVVGGLSTPAVVWAMRTFGWRQTAFVSGLVLAAIVIIMSSIFGSSPAAHGTYVDGADPDDLDAVAPRAEGVSDIHFTAKEALRTRAFWLLSFGHASALLVVGSVVAHLSLYLTSEQGYSLQGASFVAAGLPVAQFAGMLTGGSIGDRVNKRMLCAVAMFGHMAGLLLLTFAVNAVMIWAFVVLHGLSWGVRGPLVNALRADYFGSTSYGQIMGFASMVLMFGMVGGPLLAGTLADVTGDYGMGFTILSVLAGAGSMFFIAASPPAPPSRPDAARAATAGVAG